MNPQYIKAGLSVFLGLSLAVVANVMLLQREHRRGLAPPPMLADRLGEATSPGAIAANPESQDNAVTAAAAPVSETEIIRSIQTTLTKRGYHPGPVDGVAGMMTRAALLAFEYDNSLELTAMPSPERLKQMIAGADLVQGTRPVAARGVAVSEPARRIIRSVQDTLHGLGYDVGSVDGQLREQTVRAIRDFEVDHSMSETGRVSGALVARLAGLAVKGRLASNR